ncbi:lipoprotein-anchoring transpeptidase ErfK/SrfK [Motilibacter rhizosphaerae]|uniref:Lipoprotein-anchoring transpeptidase ErfK/SrfK n=1 Tax=Motilibacter rhizosphaerae TaxID=598652 RepID=A0A4Q7NRL2_9ACTN|nr:Ig-like domain-containing protein [Motilibacter rhizosphaerae]RZS89554.1 lipoprotein-anchoring transpeptidase ErfK/SrfK [Motilibacter rhizosphaerae]
MSRTVVSGGRLRVEARRRRLALQWGALLLAGAAVPALSGCQATEAASAAPPSSAAPSPSPSATPVRPSAARVALAPATGAQDVRLDAPVTVDVTGGTLSRVDVKDASGAAVEGAIGADGRTWVPTDGLEPATTYTVRAYAADPSGAPRSLSATWTTVAATKVLKTSIAPLDGTTRGVGMPIIVTFNTPVDKSARAAVEKALHVSGSKRLVGAWSWQSSTTVHYRTRAFFPAHSTVTLDAHLAGVEVHPGVWGTPKSNRSVSYSIGASMVSVADVANHTMVVRRDGKVWAKFPITTGKPNFRTRGGIRVIMEKYPTKIMDAATVGIKPGDPEYYKLEVHWAMRISTSGEFVHAAPWSTGSQGRANVSHGCVGLSMANGEHLFANSQIGDVVKIINSTRPLNKGNGWTDWNGTWASWLADSATGVQDTPASS